jgi:carbamoyl-phosphate synthase small subunit
VIPERNVDKLTRQVAKLAMEDGTVFTGQNLGATGTVEGEVCFNTSMTGYQEILTDPSYRGQIVTMTYPLIGNYGTGPEDTESGRIQASGFVIREPAQQHSNFRANKSLEQYLQDSGVVGISHIDTRALTRKIRLDGAMKGVISTEILDDHELVAMAKKCKGLVGLDLVREVTCSKSSTWSQGFESKFSAHGGDAARKLPEESKPRIVAIDCGMKQNIPRNLVERGFHVTIVPARTTIDQIMAFEPQGIFVSNGPGDPEPITYTIETIKGLIAQELPVFGICLGLQLIGQALGGTTYKLKFGHRGGNQPVKNLDTGKVEITSQNHGFAVDIASLNESDVRVTHINLNDQTLEGIAHKKLPVFAVQYHPEASPGPHDASYLFDAFYAMVQNQKAPELICGQ